MIPGQEAIELSIGQSSEIRIYSVSATGLAHTHSKRERERELLFVLILGIWDQVQLRRGSEASIPNH